MPRRVTRREFIESTVATTALVANTPRGAAAERPNVLFILADDLVLEDVPVRRRNARTGDRALARHRSRRARHRSAAITMDWTATILGVTGTAPDPAFPLDGENLMPACTGKRPSYDRTFWRIRGFAAARIGRWKYLKNASGERLFDLSIDLGEKSDLRPLQSDRFELLKGQYDAWASQMLPLPAA